MYVCTVGMYIYTMHERIVVKLRYVRIYSRDVTNIQKFDCSMTFCSKNEFQITLLLTNIKFKQKIWSCLLIFDQNFKEDNSNLSVFSNNFTIFAILRGKPLK